ncbi:MAG: hypothetical protein DRJ10_20840 [Bacteroidetes bacterium]|nr:MAG: hypothetical protein DRJ10_20840 [Bacteroidota bacterium]
MHVAKIIEQKGHEYTLKEKDGIYYLIIPMLIGVGADVIHTFSKSDKQQYDKEPNLFIKSKIAKMKENPKNFEIKSWR